MRKYKIIFLIFILLLMSIFTNVVLLINLITDNQELVNNDVATPVSDIECLHESKFDDIIKNFFTTFFEYNNSTYEKRYEEIKLYVSESVYRNLTAGEKPITPEISVVNTLLDLQIFKGQKGDFIVIIKTKSTIENTESKDITQMFKVHLQDNGTIDRLVGLGNIEV